MGKFENEKHMFYYARKMFTSRVREVAFGEERFEKLCTYIYQTANEHKDKMINKGVVITKFDEKFTYKLYEMLEGESDNLEIEGFIRKFVKELFKFQEYLEGNNQLPNVLDEEFTEEYFITSLEPISVWGKEFSSEFEKDFRKHARSYGIYFIYDDNEELIYIGKSKNLFERLANSLRERGGDKYSFALTKTKSDYHLYEIYYIAKLEPKLNVDSAEQDELTVTLPGLEFSEIKEAWC